MSPTLSYWTVQPDRWTFGARKIRNWVEARLDGRVLNACAGQTHLDHDGSIVRNDINPKIDADFHLDVRDLPEVLENESFDVLILDPPFSARQTTDTYGHGPDAHLTSEALGEVVDTLLKPGGRLIQFGYTTTLMPTGNEYALDEVAIWNTLGRQHDWLATVARKPSRDDIVESSRPLHVTDTAVPNEHAITRGDTTTSGNSNMPITLEYIRLDTDISPQAGVADYVTTQLTGRVLDVSCSERSLPHDDHLVQTSVDEAIDADYHLDERKLSHEFAAGIFETVLLDLPGEAFQQTVTYEGRRTGRDTALKQEVHPLVAAGGRIIQVGHTATCMPDRLDYRRQRVAVIEHPDNHQDWLVSIDTKQTPGLDVVAADRSPRDIHVQDSDANPQHTCIRCGTGWYLHPAWYVDCPTCGARPENYCVADDGTILYRPHPDRLVYLDEYHAQYECTPGTRVSRQQSGKSIRDKMSASSAIDTSTSTKQEALTHFSESESATDG